jgi:hypothetical protein
MRDTATRQPNGSVFGTFHSGIKRTQTDPAARNGFRIVNR